mgnify:CR=1 FL=1
MIKMSVKQHIPTAVPGMIGGATLLTAVAISVLFFSSVEPNCGPFSAACVASDMGLAQVYIGIGTAVLLWDS